MIVRPPRRRADLHDPHAAVLHDLHVYLRDPTFAVGRCMIMQSDLARQGEDVASGYSRVHLSLGPRDRRAEIVACATIALGQRRAWTGATSRRDSCVCNCRVGSTAGACGTGATSRRGSCVCNYRVGSTAGACGTGATSRRDSCACNYRTGTTTRARGWGVGRGWLRARLSHGSRDRCACDGGVARG